MKAHIIGDKKLMEAFDELKRTSTKELEKEIMAAGLLVKTTAVEKIQQSPASGEWYFNYKSHRWHRASAPGEPPATDEGILASSIEVKQVGNNVYVFTGKKYGKYLELGTLHIAPRPWLKPSLKEHRDDIQKNIGRAIMRGAKKAKQKGE